MERNPSVEENAAPGGGGLAEWAAAPLAVLAPFVVFVAQHRYGLLRPEIGLLVAGLVAVGLLASLAIRVGGVPVRVLLLGGLLTFYADVQFELSSYREVVLLFAGCVGICWLLRQRLVQIAAGFFALVILANLVIPSGPRYGDRPVPAPDMSGHVADLPPVLHVILDEHIGVEAIPLATASGRALKRELTDFYVRRGFRLHGRAYSQYFDTTNSIANLLNFASRDRDGAWFEEGSTRHPLSENAWFRHLSEQGYALRIYESDFIDFCAAGDVRITACDRYPSTSIRSIRDLPLPVLQKASFVFRSVLGLSTTLDDLRARYAGLRASLVERGFDPPVWPRDPRVGPIPVVPVLEALRAEIAASPRGTAFFAHLLHPHYPYVYDAECRLRPDTDIWLEATSPAVPDPRQNTSETRAERYELYFDQIRCLLVQLDELLGALAEAGVADEAVVVIQGDHGSRIVQYAPLGASADRMTPTDQADAFAALFAAKAPHLEAGYVGTIAPLQNLLREVAGLEPTVSGTHRVYLYESFRGPLRTAPMLAFEE